MKFGDRILNPDSSTTNRTTKADSNLQQWEKNILKTIARYKSLFLKQKAIFSLQSAPASTMRNTHTDNEQT